MLRFSVVFLMIGAAVATLSGQSLPLVVIQVTEIVAPPGAAITPMAISQNGNIAGWMQNTTPNSVERAFAIISGTLVELPALPGKNHSRALAINDRGQLAGYSYGPGDRAFFYENGLLVDMGTLGGTEAVAHGIDSQGRVVGYSRISSGPTHAFVGFPGGLIDLGTLGGQSSAAFAISESGEIAGGADIATGGSRAFVFANGTMTDRGALEAVGATATSINSLGQIAGAAGTPLGDRAFVGDAAGPLRNIGTLGGAFSKATGINANGEVVGLSVTAEPRSRPFVYTGGVIQDLNRLLPPGTGWTLYHAFAINDSRQVVGVGDVNGRQAAFLLRLGVDEVPPEIQVTTPTQDAVFTLGASVAADYECRDTWPAVSCDGTIEDGQFLSTNQVGEFIFSVTSTDGRNSSSFASMYAVTYGVCTDFDTDRAFRAGGTAPIRLRLCSALGANLSGPDKQVIARSVQRVSGNATTAVNDSGNANPDGNFRLVGDSYIFNLSLAGFAVGTYKLTFDVSGDPSSHELYFQVR